MQTHRLRSVADSSVHPTGLRTVSHSVAFEYGPTNAILYALSIGTPAGDLEHVFEGVNGGLGVLPSFASIPAAAFLGWANSVLGFAAESAILGEQTLRVTRPLPAAGQWSSRAVIAAVYDKGSGALVVTEVTTSDPEGRVIAENTLSTFVRGAGGFGGERGPARKLVLPGRPPNARARDATWTNLAALYRLNGDDHPLHVDPAAAAASNLPRPPLHGMCVLGHAVRAALTVAGPVRGAFEVSIRYLGPAFPGETLVTSLWREGGRILYRIEREGQSGAVAEGSVCVSDEPSEDTRVERAVPKS